MQQRSFETTAIILDKAWRAEGDMLLNLMCAERGLFACIKKTSKTKAAALPDFFDTVRADAEIIGLSDLYALKDFEILARRTRIAENYNSFLMAGEICRRTLKNGKYLAEPEPFFALLTSALDALNSEGCAQAVGVKFSYVFAKLEGYAVKEDFARALAEKDRALLSEILSKSAAECAELDADKTRALGEKLLRWTRANTDIIC